MYHQALGRFVRMEILAEWTVLRHGDRAVLHHVMRKRWNLGRNCDVLSRVDSGQGYAILLLTTFIIVQEDPCPFSPWGQACIAQS